MRTEIITDVVANGLIKAIDYIENNLITNEENLNALSINEISQKSNISPSYLQDIFKKLYDSSLHTYIIRRKMSLASHDLIETKEKITDIARKYGYELDSFIRRFKKIYSITPTEYRRNGKVEKEFLPITIEVDNVEAITNFDDLYLIEKNCINCVFCMGNGCAGRNEEYGKPIKDVIKKFPNGCEEFEYTLNNFIENEKLKEELFSKL